MNTFAPKLAVLPLAQQQLWAALGPVRAAGFVLYGGTAIALRLGHRTSVDFDFFTSRDIDAARIRASLPEVQQAEVIQEQKNTLEVLTKPGVKLSFFGGIGFGRVGDPECTDDGVMVVASLADLMATKLKVLLQRTEAKDYTDIAAMVRSGVSLAVGLAAAEQMFRPTFPVQHSLRALTYFQGGDLARVTDKDRADLVTAASSVRFPLPPVPLHSDISAPGASRPEW